MRRRTLVMAMMAAAALTGMAAREVAAQSFHLLPSVGLYVPVADIGQVQKAGVEGVIDFGRAESTLAFGLTGAFADEEGLGLRLSLMYATASDIPIGGVGCGSCSARSTLLIGTVAGALRPFPEFVGIRPYVLVGLGLKRYDFSPKNFDELAGVLDDQTQGTVQLGLGTDVNLLGLGLFAEVNSYLNNLDPIKKAQGVSDSQVQYDFVFSVGVTLGG